MKPPVLEHASANQAGPIPDPAHTLKGQAVRSTVTNVALSMALKACVFAQSIVVARLFSPAEMGLFTTALMAAWFAMLFAESGANQAIIRDPSDDRRVVDTGFTVNTIVGLGLFSVLLLAAPLIAARTHHPDAATYIRLLALLTFTQALVIPSAVLIKRLHFVAAKIPHFIEVAVFLTTTVILFKVFSAGVWSLVWGRLAGFAALYTSLWMIAPYRPRWRFEIPEIRRLLSFGWPLLVVGLCSYVVWQGDQWLILYFWGPEQLAYYVLAFSLPYYMKEFSDMVSSTLFPIFAKVQGGGYSLRRAFDESSRYLAVLGVFLGAILCVFAPAIIHFVYTDKWAPAIPLLRWFSIAMTLSVVIGYNWGAVAVVRGKTRFVMTVNLWIVALLATLGVALISQWGPSGGVLFMMAHVLVMIGVFRLPFLYRELHALSFLGQVARIIAAGVIAGGIAHFTIVPWIATFVEFLVGLMAFGLLYLAALAVCDRRILRDLLELSSIASHRRWPLRFSVKRALCWAALVAGGFSASQAWAVTFETVIYRVQSGGGAYTDVVLDAQGMPHISHTGDGEEDAQTVRYSRWGTIGSTDREPEWITQCLDRPATFTSAVVDRNGQRHLAYTDPDGATGPGAGALHYGSFVNLWKLQKVDENLGWMSGEVSIAVDADARPRIAYVHARDQSGRPVGDLRYAAWDGQAWATEVVKASEAGRRPGAWNALAVDAAGVPFVAYRDEGLWLAVRDAGTWQFRLLDGGAGSGYEVSMVMDAREARHLAYIDTDLRAVRYLEDGGAPETVALVPWATADRLARRETPLAIGVRPDGLPVIAFSDIADAAADPSSARVRLAYRTGTGQWTVLDVDGGGAGLHVSMGLTTAGHLVIAYFDAMQKELKVAFLIDRDLSPAPAAPFGKLEPVPDWVVTSRCTSTPRETMPASTTDAAAGLFGCGLVRLTGDDPPGPGDGLGEMALLMVIPVFVALKRRWGRQARVMEYGR